MIFKRLKSGLEVNDHEFDSIYTESIRVVSEIHFTPMDVAKVAAHFLVDKKGTRVLDVGSGAGKFCMIGAASTNGHFTGVEQRESLYLLSRKLALRHGLTNTAFYYSNITEIDFSAFDAFYLFNPFYEHVFQSNPIDYSVKLERCLYDKYSGYVKEQLNGMPAGTRMATYFSYSTEIPQSYHLESSDFDRKLKLWRKAY